MDVPEGEIEVIWALIPRLVGAFQRRMARNLADDGLTLPQFVTLRVLAQAGGQRRMGPLAAATMQSAAAMTGIVDRLLERGLVQRERNPQDRRSVVVQLTAEGQALLDRVQERNKQWGRALLQSLSPDEQRLLHTVLARVIEWIDAGIDR